MKIFLGLILVISFCAFALEVDEKLTVRVIRTSETRKTLMINRGTEDGLVEGDHAKFIVTAGIVARAVCIKVSPTRSVWSVYRLVNADFIVNDSVMTIKIAPPVKITKDETQAIVQEDTPTKVTSGDLGIPLADGAQDIPAAGEDNISATDLKALESEETSAIPEKNMEVFGVLNISGLTANTKTSTGDNSFNNSQSSHHIGLGGELYSRREREWYSHFSLQAMANLMRNNSQAYNGASATNDNTDLSLGVNWHPTKLPSQTMVFIPYLHASFNIGTVKSTYKSGTEGNGVDRELSASGSTSGFAVGFGYKFYTKMGFSVRALADYYMRSEKYKQDDLSNTFNKTVGGPRLMLGIGYRF
jgi:opacity protein-like surface antigen